MTRCALLPLIDNRQLGSVKADGLAFVASQQNYYSFCSLEHLLTKYLL
jgi:hypothetical protein